MGGVPNGGAASGGAPTGGAASGGASSEVWYYWCYRWEVDIKNEPLPGKVGIAACPSFYELDLVEPHSPYCYVEANPEPAVPTGPEPPSGDCCYGITYYHCR
jgi:hypothetical protein